MTHAEDIIEGILAGPWAPWPDEAARTHELSPLGFVRPAVPRVGYRVPVLLKPRSRSARNLEPVYGLLRPGGGKVLLAVVDVFAAQDVRPPEDLGAWMRAARVRVDVVNDFIRRHRREPRGRSYRGSGDTAGGWYGCRCPWNDLGARAVDMGLPPFYEARRPDFLIGF